ncbi:hypothetical protein C7212DRAFT_343518 [Tuber magnatum]|uniref:HECT-type E3 ubiquitin transferase n=1 Tax=Tuber magnatum TaxID=42249 RepID=A0A317SSE0_9PEZI|nr:hypothetical protein C7212DRAFT_343518 [Tuber magnatum]
MYPTFTGSSRRPRNVNLSGRKPAAAPSRTTQFSRPPAIPTSVLHAQHERAQREAARQRLRAATTVQRVWRGRREAEAQRVKWRKEWDSLFAEGAGGNFGRGSDLGKWIEYGVTLFLAFYERGRRPGRHRERDSGDLLRMKALVLFMAQYLSRASEKSCLRVRARGVDGRGNLMMEKFGKLLIEVLQEGVLTVVSLRVLPSLAVELPGIVDASYYKALSRITTSRGSSPEDILGAVLTPLQHVEGGDGRRDAQIHRDFAANYLVTPDLPEHLRRSGFERLKETVGFGKLIKAMSEHPGQWVIATSEERLWMLSYIIHFTPNASGSKAIDLTGDRPLVSSDFEEQRYIHVMSRLLSSVAKEASKRTEVEDISMGAEGDEGNEDVSSERSHQNRSQPLPPFVKSKLESLIQQPSITSIFSRANFSGSNDRHAKMLAGFALTLLLVFPKVKQEVCMWLCLAETKDGVSALGYLWAAVGRSKLFRGVTRDIRLAVSSLRGRNLSTDDASVRDSDNDEWNLILLFVELYGFLLLVMDDDEFFTGSGADRKARQLPLKDVENLSVFLKNLAFAMYYWGGEIMGEDRERSDGRAVFSKDQANRGWEVEHLKTVVTALLKAIYARDSRRRFLPSNHWLMTAAGFNIEGFIPAVVQEEENRHQMEGEGEEEDGEEPERQYDQAAIAALSPYERRNLRLELMSKMQHKKQRELHLAIITPRLEILQNLPFFIPFATRVQVFREFVSGDQRRRRGGFVEPDQWRAAVLSQNSQLHSPARNALDDARDSLNKHHATIRRNRVFEDAYEQFWPLGEGLKEPIQITFVDRFGVEEAGIDGGGVTKEFLTGVCGDAFTPSAIAGVDREADSGDDAYLPSDDEAENATEFGKNLFLENEQHLLYPNPISIEELKEDLIRTGCPYQEVIGDGVKPLLKRYEFLGRVLGKCLYEGILVDVAFAPFFLLKWSQQASSSKASTAVGVNDLRDLDEGLYRGLVKLKNYTGDVESDFGLDFTISSRLPRHDKTITVELRTGGEAIPVTNANKLEYIHLVSRYRLSVQAHIQTSAFLRGLNSIINPSWLSMFNQSELQTLVGGDIDTPIDVEDLRRNTIYGGVYQIGDDGVEHESIRLFWQVMRSLGDEERRKVLKFVTSVARAPLLGFGVLRPRFSIRDAGEDQGRLCSASTCVNLLKLPRYRDPKILREKLLYSVNSNAGFDLS